MFVNFVKTWWIFYLYLCWPWKLQKRLTNSCRDWCSASHGVLPCIHHKLLFIIAVTALVGNWSACTLPIFLHWKIFILQGGTVINWYFPIIKKSIYLATISSSFSKLSLSCWVILMTSSSLSKPLLLVLR